MDYVKFYKDLVNRPAGSVKWVGTQRDLVELVVMVASKRVFKDRRGFPLSQKVLAELAFRAVGKKPPCNVRSIAYRIRNQVRPMPTLEERIHGDIVI